MEAVRELGMIHVKAMCVIAREGKILATRGVDTVTGEKFFRLVGGGVHFCELATNTLKREVREELLTEIENVTFLEVVRMYLRISVSQVTKSSSYIQLIWLLKSYMQKKKSQ